MKFGQVTKLRKISIRFECLISNHIKKNISSILLQKEKSAAFDIPIIYLEFLSVFPFPLIFTWLGCVPCSQILLNCLSQTGPLQVFPSHVPCNYTECVSGISIYPFVPRFTLPSSPSIT